MGAMFGPMSTQGSGQVYLSWCSKSYDSKHVVMSGTSPNNFAWNPGKTPTERLLSRWRTHINTSSFGLWPLWGGSNSPAGGELFMYYPLWFSGRISGSACPGIPVKLVLWELDPLRSRQFLSQADFPRKDVPIICCRRHFLNRPLAWRKLFLTKKCILSWFQKRRVFL